MGAGEAILDFIRTELMVDPDAHLELDTPLLQGLLDSSDLLRLLSFLQEDFGVEIEYEELTTDVLGSVRAIERFVERETSRR
ncbi:MAG TPA: phosphopantetheine-binding protein [Actinomycetota bacterium]|jgi:acyl carrier protein